MRTAKNRQNTLNEDLLELIVAARNLNEINSLSEDALVNESLSSGRMSLFLSEAPGGNPPLPETLEKAIDRADKVLSVLEKAGTEFPSGAITAAVEGIREKLVSVKASGKSGAYGGIADLAGKSAVPITHIANSLTEVVIAVNTVTNRVKDILKLSKVDLESNKEKSLKDLVRTNDLKGFKNEAELQKVISKAAVGGVKKKVKGLTDKLLGMLKRAPTVELDPDQFAIDILNAKIGPIVAYANSNVAAVGQDPTSMIASLTNPVVNPGEGGGGGGGGGGGAPKPAKTKIDSIKTHLTSNNLPPEEVDAVLNAVKDLLRDKGIVEGRSRLFSQRVPLHKQQLSSLIFENNAPPANPPASLTFDEIVNMLKGKPLGPSNSRYTEEQARKAARLISSFITSSTSARIEGAPSPGGGAGSDGGAGGSAGAQSVARDKWPGEMGLPKEFRKNTNRLDNIARYVNKKAGKKVLENENRLQSAILVERWSILAGTKDKK